MSRTSKERKNNSTDTDILQEDQMTIFLSIPKNAIKLNITAICMADDDTLFEAVTKMSVGEIIENRLLEDDWEANNVKYRLTDYGKESLSKGEII